MSNISNFEKLLTSLTENISDEELLLSTLQSDIAATITSTRNAKGLSQKDLADALDVSQSLVSRWESGDANFTLQTLVKIAMTLDIKMRSPYYPDRLPRFQTVGHVVTLPMDSDIFRSMTSPNQVWGMQAENEDTFYLREN